VTAAWSDARLSLIAWVASCARMSLDAVYFADEPLSLMQGASAALSQLSLRNPGGLDATVLRREGTQLIGTTGGTREMLLQVAFDTDDQELSGHPSVLAERFRTRASSPDSHVALDEFGYGLLSVGDVLVAGRDIGGRMFPRAIVEVRLSFLSAEEGNPIRSIASSSAQGEVVVADATVTIPAFTA
jgi:hypothetical protein